MNPKINEKTNIHLGNGKIPTYESDYKKNYLEHAIDDRIEADSKLKTLKKELRKTNFTLNNTGLALKNPIESTYAEDFNKKRVLQENQNLMKNPNLQKTNFLFGHLTTHEKHGIYQSETHKNFNKTNYLREQANNSINVDIVKSRLILILHYYY